MSFNLKIFILGMTVFFFAATVPRNAMSSDDQATKLTYLTEDFKPYNYQEYGQAKGLAVELLILVWKEMGVQALPIEFTPWPRAYEMIQKQPNTVLFSMVKTTEREPLFKWVGPIAQSRTLLVAREDTPINMRSIEDAKGLTVGVVRDYMSAIILERHKDIVTIDTLSSVDLCIKKLSSRRLDLISIEENTFNLAMQKKHISQKKFKTAWVLNNTLSYYAFSKDVDDATIARFQKAFDAIIKTPEYTRLVGHYLK